MARSAAWYHVQTCIEEAMDVFEQSPILAINDFLAKVKTREETKGIAESSKAIAMLREGPERYENGKYKGRKEFHKFLQDLSSSIR